MLFVTHTIAHVTLITNTLCIKLIYGIKYITSHICMSLRLFIYDYIVLQLHSYKLKFMPFISLTDYCIPETVHRSLVIMDPMSYN